MFEAKGRILKGIHGEVSSAVILSKNSHISCIFQSSSYLMSTPVCTGPHGPSRSALKLTGVRPCSVMRLQEKRVRGWAPPPTGHASARASGCPGTAQQALLRQFAVPLCTAFQWHPPTRPAFWDELLDSDEALG